MTNRRRSRKLSQEERDLWALVTRHDMPIHKPSPAKTDENRGAMTEPAERSEAAKGGAAGRSPKGTTVTASPAVATSSPAPPRRAPSVPPLAAFEARRAKMLARKQLTIDARLDLHGMRRGDAHSALRRFLHECQLAGHRHVLIITGKGSRNETSDDFWTGDERGVLRRLVPQWLGDADCRRFVLSFTEAGVKHGGGGALYVSLRKGRSSR